MARCDNETGKKRVYTIAREISKGLRYSKILDKYSSMWKISESTVRDYITKAKILIKEDEQSLDDIKTLNKDRLTDIYREARENSDLKEAINAVDKLNKTAGVYDKTEEKTEININFEYE